MLATIGVVYRARSGLDVWKGCKAPVGVFGDGGALEYVAASRRRGVGIECGDFRMEAARRVV